MRKIKLTEESKNNILENLLKRSPNSYGQFESAVNEILENVKKNKDAAIFDYTKRFDGADINADNIVVTKEEIEEAYTLVDEKLVEVIRKALVNIRDYHQKQKQYSWFDSKPDGTMLGQKVTALSRVGVYVPGGKAVYPSSVLMNIIPAKVAGVEQIVMTTPPAKDGKVYPATLVAANEAGVDVIDTAMSPLAMGTSHPATESMVAALKGTEYDTGLDIKALSEIRDFFTPLREKYLKSGLLDPKMLGVDANTLLYQVPGGMLSNLVSQLKQAGKADKLDEVLAEVPRVREDSGYPPLVTPTSQIVGTQAVFNVIMGERYKMVTKEFKDMVAGKYGKTPCDIDPEFQKKIVGDEEIITCRPADLIHDKIDDFKADIAEYYEQEEDVLSYAQFGQVAVKFFQKRRDKKYNLDGKHEDFESKVHPV